MYPTCKVLQKTSSQLKRKNSALCPKTILEKKEEEASKHFFLTSFEKDLFFVDNFLLDIAVFRGLLLEAFLQPLIDALAHYSLPTGTIHKFRYHTWRGGKELIRLDLKPSKGFFTKT